MEPLERFSPPERAQRHEQSNHPPERLSAYYSLERAIEKSRYNSEIRNQCRKWIVSHASPLQKMIFEDQMQDALHRNQEVSFSSLLNTILEIQFRQNPDLESMLMNCHPFDRRDQMLDIKIDAVSKVLSQLDQSDESRLLKWWQTERKQLNQRLRSNEKSENEQFVHRPELNDIQQMKKWFYGRVHFHLEPAINKVPFSEDVLENHDVMRILRQTLPPLDRLEPQMAEELFDGNENQTIRRRNPDQTFQFVRSEHGYILKQVSP